MRIRRYFIRRAMGIFCAAAAGALLIPGTVAFATQSGSAATTTAFRLMGSTAGAITTIQPGQTLTFVFTEVNDTTRGAYEDLGLTKVVNVRVTDMTCVLPGGIAIEPDTPFCEPGLVKPGQRASAVLTTAVIGSSGTASARVCLSNENTGVRGPCKVVSSNIA